jgi:hypothetical protein
MVIKLIHVVGRERFLDIEPGFFFDRTFCRVQRRFIRLDRSVHALPAPRERYVRASPQKQKLRAAVETPKNIGIDNIGSDPWHGDLQGFF